MTGRYFRYAFITVLIVIAQTTVFHYLNIAGISPDLLAIWVVYIALKEGQLAGTVWGFFIGLGVDFVSGNFLGLTALSKTIGGFVAGYYHDEIKLRFILGSYRFLLVVFLSSLFQHMIYFLLFTRGSDIDIVKAVVEFGVTTTLYTTLLSLFPVMFMSRKAGTVNVE